MRDGDDAAVRHGPGETHHPVGRGENRGGRRGLEVDSAMTGSVGRRRAFETAAHRDGPRQRPSQSPDPAAVGRRCRGVLRSDVAGWRVRVLVPFSAAQRASGRRGHGRPRSFPGPAGRRPEGSWGGGRPDGGSRRSSR